MLQKWTLMWYAYATTPCLFSALVSGQGSLTELYYCFTGRVSQLQRKFFPKVISQRQYLRGLMHSQNCSQSPLLKGQTLPLTLPSSHPGWHLQQTLFCLLKLKLVSQELHNQAVESIIKQGKELAWWEVGEKEQQHLKTSDIPLTDNWAWNQNCTLFSLTGCHSLQFHAVTGSPNPAPRYHALQADFQLSCSQSWVCPFNWFSDSFFILHQSLFWWYWGFLRQAVLAAQANFPDKPNSSPLNDQSETKSSENQHEVWNSFLITEIWLKF